MVKRAATWFTAERVARARTRVTHAPEAAAQCAAALAAAEPLLSLSFRTLWDLVPPQVLPRSYAVNQDLGSPISGIDLYRHGRYPWLADPLNRPWKIVDPESGNTFPTNDFGAYYRSGIGPDGAFDSARADRTLLVNTLYPERGADWGVDDGFGWHDDNGNTWTFIAYYIHWWLWYGAGAISTSEPIITTALQTLQTAWLLTGDVVYARPALVLLDRIADCYPAMDTSAYRREDGFLASDGWRRRGKIVGSIWEASLARQLIEACDALFPALAEPGIEPAIQFLQEQSVRHGLADKSIPDAVWANLEHGILRQIFPAVRDAQIGGNFGMHQRTLAMAAVVLDHPIETPTMLEFVLQVGEYEPGPPPRITGGNVLSTLVNQVDRDGFGDESAPGYNALWVDQMIHLAEIFRQAPEGAAADLEAHPAYRRMFEAWPRLLLHHTYTPTIGDTPTAGGPLAIGKASHYVEAFHRWGDPVFAQYALVLANGNREALAPELFSDLPEDIVDRVVAAAEAAGPLEPRSDNLAGYGLAILRDGTGPAARDAWLAYGRTTGHGHGDALNLGIHARGIDFAPDLGYPDYADHNPKRIEWIGNTISHNTVVVDRQRQGPMWVGVPHCFVDAGAVQLMDVAAPAAYPALEEYRRSVVMVRIDAEDSYLVDTFRVSGETEHWYSFHGPEGEVSTTDLELVHQDGGSAEGTDVPYGAPGASPRQADGLAWLENVATASAPPGQFSATWHAKDTWGVHPEPRDLRLRLTMLGNLDRVLFGDGQPARNQPGNPLSLRYLLACRMGEHLRSTFRAVIEPYQGTPRIHAIRPLEVTAATGCTPSEVNAVACTLAGGREHIVIVSPGPDCTVTVDGRYQFTGRCAVIHLRHGVAQEATLIDSSHLEFVGGEVVCASPAAWSGTVIDFTREHARENTIDVAFDAAPTAARSLAGATVTITNDGERNACYTITSAAPIGSSHWRLDIGAATTIRGYRDAAEPARGFSYDIAPGARFRIARTHTFTRH